MTKQKNKGAALNLQGYILTLYLTYSMHIYLFYQKIVYFPLNMRDTAQFVFKSFSFNIKFSVICFLYLITREGGDIDNEINLKLSLPLYFKTLIIYNYPHYNWRLVGAFQYFALKEMESREWVPLSSPYAWGSNPARPFFTIS